MNKNKKANGRTKEIKLITSLTRRGQKRGDSKRVLPRLFSKMNPELLEYALFVVKQHEFKTPSILGDASGKYGAEVENHRFKVLQMPIHGYRLDCLEVLKSKQSFAVGSSTDCNCKSIFKESIFSIKKFPGLFSLGGGS